MTEILDVNGQVIVSDKKKKEKQKPSRAERRRMLRDPAARNKIIATSEGVPEYYRMLAYGQLLIYEMGEIQMRMLAIPRARGRRPVGQREALQEELVTKWNEATEKLEEVQKIMEKLEAEEKEKEEAKKKNLIEVQ